MEVEMPESKIETGIAAVNNALIYYEVAGKGEPFVMIHAGIADSRQWNNEFIYFAKQYQVLRYDMRGYGKSEPIEGEFSHLEDLTRLLEYLHIEKPLIVMGCSMGGGIAMNLALSKPSMVKALIMVGSGPPGLELDVPQSPKFVDGVKAYEAGDLDLTAEIETQIWFDGTGRSPSQVNQVMRRLAYDMDRLALAHDAKKLGKRLPDSEVPAAERLSELRIPILLIVGENDEPYSHAATKFIVEELPFTQKIIIEDAAHLPNMEHPEEFQRIVSTFLDDLAA
jgi:pimeloyl-ACP methyl ester carboxylesterase